MAARSSKIVVAAHGHCFDGLASAAMFTELRRQTARGELKFRYLSCGYGPNLQTIPEKWLSGDENAIVDFRYTPSQRLSWYFDHHVTAFASDEQRDRALEHKDRFFYDPTYGSCTKLIADVARDRFGVRLDRFADLVAWADRIDSARFASAQEAIDRTPPVMQLAAVVEQHGDAPFYERVAPLLVDQLVDDIATSDDIQRLWRPIADAAEETQRRIADRLQLFGDVTYAELPEQPLKASGKFVAYALTPACVYSVALVRMKQHFKVSVGYNPWCRRERTHDIAAICQRYGGGGHPVVGAVSVPLDRLDEARRIARAIVDELGGDSAR
jgi:hypothetical protein